MNREKYRIRETITTIIADEKFIPVAKQEIFRQRKFLENYIKRDPRFFHTLDPYTVPSDSPQIVRRMAQAGTKVGVGPMASVAGAIAEYAVKAMVEAGADHAVVDNGGDIAMYLNRPLVVGIYTGKKEIKDIGLKFQPRGRISGVCTSSATIGHSLSLGKADAAIVISNDVVLADAAATALCNSIQKKDKKLMKQALETQLNSEIEGLIVIMEDLFGMAGELSEIMRANVNYELITKG